MTPARGMKPKTGERAYRAQTAAYRYYTCAGTHLHVGKKALEDVVAL